VRLPVVAPDQVVRFTFKAQLSSDAPGASGLINIAQLFADKPR